MEIQADASNKRKRDEEAPVTRTFDSHCPSSSALVLELDLDLDLDFFTLGHSFLSFIFTILYVLPKHFSTETRPSPHSHTLFSLLVICSHSSDPTLTVLSF